MKKLHHAFFCSLIILLSVTCQAEIAQQLLPNLGSLATGITQRDKSKKDEEVFDAAGRISANLPAPDSARGRTAEEIAAILSGDSVALRRQLSEAFNSERELFEKNLTEDNFAMGDMGVAYAVSFILLWELASHRGLSPVASKRAATLMVHALRRYKERYAMFNGDDKARVYDWLVTTPVAISSLVTSFEKEGRLKDAEMLRQRSASLFLNTFKLPHDMVRISQSGEISVDVGEVFTYQQAHGLDADW